MDGLRDNMDAPFPDYYLDFMEVEGDLHCEQCPFGVVNGEHVEPQQVPTSSRSFDGVDLSRNVEPEGNEALPSLREQVAGELDANSNGNLTDDESMVDGGVHPLLFPDVVKDVLHHLPAKDVESCRLVCRVWNTEACKVLRSKRVVVFVEPDAVKIYNNSMRETSDFPHAQFEFCIQDFTGIVDEDLREFWTVFGPHIKSLEFRQTHLFWRDFLEVLEEKVPNLEKLALRHLPRNILRSRNVVNERHQLPSVKELRLASLPGATPVAMERLTDLLKSLPNLEVIEFLPIKAGAVKTKVSTVLIDILRSADVNLPNLRSLNVSLELSTEGLDGLASKQFQFQRLNISLANGVKATSFKDLLSSLRPTLSELNISFPDSFSNYQSFITQNSSMKPEECVQILSKLKSLNMKNFKGSINFIHKLPILQHLEFTTPNPEKSIPFGFRKPVGSSFPLSRVEDHSLKSLRIISSSPTCSIAETLTLDSISRCFPTLTCLQLHGVDDDGLGVIYRNLPFLSDVELTKATCTDQGLTGIPLEICNDMVETSTFIVVQAERYRRDLFIGSLQYLRKFSIVATQISDASIALGLVDCKNLKELKIGSPLITDTGVIFVTDKFHKQLQYLDVSECSEITEQSKFYAGEKLMGNLKVADSPQEAQSQTKPVTKEVICNPDRGIIKTKRATTTSSFGLGASTTTSSHSKYLVQDSEFFEEHSEDDLRERGFPHAAFPADHNNRLRIIRIREALRRNGDFMRTLQRMGLQQFRQVFGRELQDAENNAAPLPNPMQMQNVVRFRRRNLLNLEIGGVMNVMFPNPNDGPHPHQHLRPPRVGIPQAEVEANIRQENELRELEERERQEAIQVIFEEDDGGPAAAGGGGDMGPGRLPEIHLAEIFRLGLRLDDVEYWLRNRLIFEREENGHPNIDPPMLRQLRADVLLAGMNLVEDEANAAIGGEDEDLDLEAIRRVVMNAFGDDLPFEG